MPLCPDHPFQLSVDTCNPRMSCLAKIIMLALFSVFTIGCSQEQQGYPEVPEALEDPDDFQAQRGPARSEDVQVFLKPGEGTEIKAVLNEKQMMMFQWVSNLPVYVDFHGHDPNDESYWYRYREMTSAMTGSGSLVAPVTGDHGWYFLNDSDQEVTIDVRVTGYFNELKDLGVFPPSDE